MPNIECQLFAVKLIIEQGKVQYFQDIFLYVRKSQLAQKIGMPYSRFLSICFKPDTMNDLEIQAISAAIGINQLQIVEMIKRHLKKYPAREY